MPNPELAVRFTGQIIARMNYHGEHDNAFAYTIFLRQADGGYLHHFHINPVKYHACFAPVADEPKERVTTFSTRDIRSDTGYPSYEVFSDGTDSVSNPRPLLKPDEDTTP